MLENDEFTSSEFLKQLVYEAPKFTAKMIKFENVGGENDVVVDDDDVSDDDETPDDAQLVASSSSGFSSQSSQSSHSQTQQTPFVCGQCKKNPKEVLMTCGHMLCSACFVNMKKERERECEKQYRPARAKKEAKKLKCPFDICSKSISDTAQQMCLDV